MKKVYLSLGSNMGDTRANLKEAMDVLKTEMEITKVSSFYETEPVGYTDQDWFLNIVVEAYTCLEPLELLAFCQDVENKMKRVKTIRFGPRNIDVDILLYEDFSINQEVLTIPHPRMKERAFVLVPLYEIAPDLLIGKEPIADILKNLKGEQVRKLED
ncbi:2-amino-4-hydroxy-6-hydroxymethyldihydropteridine diphosphokinase [Parasporobacterium paucivorans]|uniref:2-amino-4-hydroxy-6-hydroxymethyldihydropteridine diphosphokinase n=1 Tax=Parasporobacterium paucivorans DSM 15970 TaxID=1122934 RepID=A0A1M6FWN2_9FIRM|nr:2-amino-4-hydroxy-6-hydroxymethyldihydropteridine diphosphokinase [Parasporobacterium paucivorans]SHJ02019.1 2-amino-4-hydroxy-6-hydroxymethyldihydropteridinediphosphokinase [Parasporobacterium paucivorans DSM 15970]